MYIVFPSLEGFFIDVSDSSFKEKVEEANKYIPKSGVISREKWTPKEFLLKDVEVSKKMFFLFKNIKNFKK